MMSSVARLGRYCLILALLLPALAWAIRLGEIRVYSNLGQPLQADIQISDLANFHISQLHARLASVSAFQQMEMDRPGTLNDLHFEIVPGHHGHGLIKVTTTDLVQYDHIDFLLDFSWPTGRLLRRYPIVLELPADKQVVQQQQEEVPLAHDALFTAKSETPQPRPVPTSEPINKKSSLVKYGPTTSHDQLLSVAQRVRKSDRVTLGQMALAIYQTNPDAFDGSIDRLKQGLMLTIPQEETVAQIDPHEASQIIWAREHAHISEHKKHVGSVIAKEGDNLLLIADRVKQDDSVTAEQMAWALYQTNRAGFIKQNINGLHVGQVLRVPSLVVVKKMSAQQAKQHIYQQNQTWKAQQRVVEDMLKQADTMTAPTKKLEHKPTLKKPTPQLKPKQLVTKSVKRPASPTAKPHIAQASELSWTWWVVAVALFLIFVPVFMYWRHQRREDNQDAILSHVRDELTEEGSKTVVATQNDETEIEEETVVESSAEQGNADLDVREEAKVFIAYQRYHEAEALLEEALEHDAAQSVAVMLLEVYMHLDNRDAYVQLRETLTEIDDAVMQQITEFDQKMAYDAPIISPIELGTPPSSRVRVESSSGGFSQQAIASSSMLGVPQPEEAESPGDEVKMSGDDGDLHELEELQDLENFHGLDDERQDGSQVLEDMTADEDIEFEDAPEAIAAVAEDIVENVTEEAAQEKLELPTDELEFEAGLGSKLDIQLGEQGVKKQSSEGSDPSSDLSFESGLGSAFSVKKRDLETETQPSTSIQDHNSIGFDEDDTAAAQLASDEQADGVAPQVTEEHTEPEAVETESEQSTASDIDDDGMDWQTKLDLAMAYVEIGDVQGARELLRKLTEQAGDEFAAQAQAILDDLKD